MKNIFLIATLLLTANFAQARYCESYIKEVVGEQYRGCRISPELSLSTALGANAQLVTWNVHIDCRDARYEEPVTVMLDTYRNTCCEPPYGAEDAANGTSSSNYGRNESQRNSYSCR